MSQRIDYLKYVGSLLLFGSNGIVASAIETDPTPIVYWRTLLGSILLCTIFITKGQHITVHQYPKDTAYMLLSGIATGMSWVFLYESYHITGVGISTVIYYIGPVAIMLLSPLIFKERLSIAKIICLAIVFAGALLLNNTPGETGTNSTGLACAFMSAVCHALMVIFNKKASRTKGLENPVLQVSISFITVAIFLFATEGSLPIFPMQSALPLMILGLVNTGIGCYLYFSSIGNLRAQSIVMMGYLEPLSALALASLLLGEPINLIQTAGCTMVISGALLAEMIHHSESQ